MGPASAAKPFAIGMQAIFPDFFDVTAAILFDFAAIGLRERKQIAANLRRIEAASTKADCALCGESDIGLRPALPPQIGLAALKGCAVGGNGQAKTGLTRI